VTSLFSAILAALGLWNLRHPQPASA
jgi:hypothetical protein